MSKTPDFEIFKGKDFSDLLKDIFVKSNRKDKILDQMIGQLKDYIKNANDASHLLPLIRELFDVGVRNDDHLIKLAAICQRMIANQTKGVDAAAGTFGLSPDELEQLMEEVVVIQDTQRVAEKSKEENLEDYKKRAEDILVKINNSNVTSDNFISGDSIDSELEKIFSD